jgi:phage-related protein
VERYDLRFYTHARSGRSRVREFIRAQPRKDRARIGLQLERLAQSWGIAIEAIPNVKKLEQEIWELKVGRYRIIFTDAVAGRLVLLHAFEKKSRKAPREALEVARQRLAHIRDARRSHN